MSGDLKDPNRSIPKGTLLAIGTGLIVYLGLTIFIAYNINSEVLKTDYNFLINLPQDSILNSKPPVLIFLHGKSLSGTDLSKVKKYGVIKEIEKAKISQNQVIEVEKKLTETRLVEEIEKRIWLYQNYKRH